ncbi:MAG: adenine phosphoribosyltransferase [Proteobacteria bacterium]|nr:adenine phosphoribosyltransferase [Pseudomonadota bacterium]MDA1058734.1 adenine phosphoribosyltransferase [Pseudomonadota bacterium]
MPIKSRIRTIPDYPKPGIMFRDITTLLQDPVGFRLTIEGLIQPYAGQRIDKVAAIEARGFILGGAVAEKLEAGFVPIRKKGKLPGKTIGRDYQLEYGTDRVEVHDDAILEGEKVLLVDDLIATGGTAMAAIALIEAIGGDIVSCAFVVDLPDLGGAQRIRDSGHTVHFLCAFDGD